MLDPGGDDVIAFVPAGEEYALERKVVGLAAAAGEDNLVAGTPEQRGHVAARSFKGNLAAGLAAQCPLDGLP